MYLDYTRLIPKTNLLMLTATTRATCLYLYSYHVITTHTSNLLLPVSFRYTRFSVVNRNVIVCWFLHHDLYTVSANTFTTVDRIWLLPLCTCSASHHSSPLKSLILLSIIAILLSNSYRYISSGINRGSSE